MPCAMVGAVAALSAYEGIGVVVHGSSGCWFYPRSLLHTEIGCTDLAGEDAILGAAPRVRATVDAMLDRHRRVAVVNTCVPGIVGEDLAGMLADLPVMVVDAPGFLGGPWIGHHRAIAALHPRIDPSLDGIGIDGLSPLDLFVRGNQHECERLLRLAGATVGARFAGGSSCSLEAAAPVTVVANPAFAAGPGRRAGELLGLDAVLATFSRLAAHDDRIDPGPIETECAAARERCTRVCDKFLARHDPPRVALFGEGGYLEAAARLLEHELAAECAVLGYRDSPPRGPWRMVRADDLGSVEAALGEAEPDLILGSSFEHRLRPEIPFVPIAPPHRGHWRLTAVPIIGVEGTLHLVEAVLNACSERRNA